MELEFNKVGSRWEAEFEATGNFNLHIERKKAGGLAIYQKASADDKYATDSSWSDNAPAVVNEDFSMLIYPKMIKVTSRSEPIQGIVTMEGEGSSSGSTGGYKVPIGMRFNSDDAITILPAIDTSECVDLGGFASSLSNLHTITEVDFSSCKNCGSFCTAGVRYMLIKNIGKPHDATYLPLYGATYWGFGSEAMRKSLVDSLLTYSYDRAAAGWASPCTISIHPEAMSLLTSDEISQIIAKGYNLISETGE